MFLPIAVSLGEKNRGTCGCRLYGTGSFVPSAGLGKSRRGTFFLVCSRRTMVAADERRLAADRVLVVLSSGRLEADCRLGPAGAVQSLSPSAAKERSRDKRRPRVDGWRDGLTCSCRSRTLDVSRRQLWWQCRWRRGWTRRTSFCTNLSQPSAPSSPRLSRADLIVSAQAGQPSDPLAPLAVQRYLADCYFLPIPGPRSGGYFP